ncbi:MAG: hypothetical protein ABI585_05885 [Betaproteobacteria bacterium]
MVAREGTIDATSAAWKRTRCGDFKGAADAARQLMRERSVENDMAEAVELNLVCASCAIRQGDHAKALASLEAAEAVVARPHADARLARRVQARRVQAWRAELAYFQGRYSDANNLVSSLLPALERDGDLVYAAFVLGVRIAILLARGDDEAVAALADRAVAVARASGDAYVQVQVLNVLGAVHAIARRPSCANRMRARTCRRWIRPTPRRWRRTPVRRSRTSSRRARSRRARTTSSRRGTSRATSSGSRSCSDARNAPSR